MPPGVDAFVDSELLDFGSMLLEERDDVCRRTVAPANPHELRRRAVQDTQLEEVGIL
jgi:hypothetical protein